jgi:simple sugar transport system permease protein
MNEILEFLFATLRGATPLVLAAMAGMYSERSGVVQIALEGMMLMGALAAAVTAYFTHSAWTAMLVSGFIGIFSVSIYAFFVLHLRSNQIVAGTALNILAVGIAPFVTKIFFDSTGSTPSLEVASRFTYQPPLIALVAFMITFYLFKYTRAGLLNEFAGEKPEALSSAGVSVRKIRWISLLVCGGLAGIGGSTLSLYLASAYSPNMTSGRGFMALAALIFGKWRPLPTLFACLMFAAFDVIQMRLQGNNSFVPVQFIQILPYVVTIVALAGFFGKSQAPKAIGQNL